MTTPAAPRPFLMPDLVGKKGQEVSDVLRDVDLGRLSADMKNCPLADMKMPISGQ